MAAYFLIQSKKNQHLRDTFKTKRLMNDARKEYDAAIKIQSWFRSIRIQKNIRFLSKCAIKIQRLYRGYAGRIIYRKLVKEKLEEMAKIYYNQIASMIQARWRGYCVRKYKFDFYARKDYLAALLVKNEAIRQELCRLKEQKIAQEEAEQYDREMAEMLYKSRKNHYLLSTQVCPGVYNSPTKPCVEKEISLASVSPFSKEERMTIEQAKKLLYLKTATGIPIRSYDVDGEIKTEKKVSILPPLKNKVRLQGPFRSPSAVNKQRHKQLKPSLRVATDYESVEKARVHLRQEDCAKRVIDKSFLTSSKIMEQYSPSLHTSAAYGRKGYGTKHFRVTEEQIKPNRIECCGDNDGWTPLHYAARYNNKRAVELKTFQRLVSPIPLFDELGKTY